MAKNQKQSVTLKNYDEYLEKSWHVIYKLLVVQKYQKKFLKKKTLQSAMLSIKPSIQTWEN